MKYYQVGALTQTKKIHNGRELYHHFLFSHLPTMFKYYVKFPSKEAQSLAHISKFTVRTIFETPNQILQLQSTIAGQYYLISFCNSNSSDLHNSINEQPLAPLEVGQKSLLCLSYFHMFTLSRLLCSALYDQNTLEVSRNEYNLQ